jgi:hypothetical protein
MLVSVLVISSPKPSVFRAQTSSIPTYIKLLYVRGSQDSGALESLN